MRREELRVRGRRRQELLQLGLHRRWAARVHGVRAAEQNTLALVEVNEERGLVLLRGNVPGPNGAVVELQASAHAPRRIPGLQVVGEIRSKNPMKASKAGG